MSLYMQPEHSGSEHLTHRSGRFPRLPRLCLVRLHLQVGCRIRYLRPSLRPPCGGQLASQRLAGHFWSPHSQRGRGEKRAPLGASPTLTCCRLLLPAAATWGSENEIDFSEK